jgi:hypothetical protein
MKKMFVVALVVSSMALAACGKKKTAEAPKGGSDMTAPAGGSGSAMPAGSDAPAAGSGEAGGGSAM